MLRKRHFVLKINKEQEVVMEIHKKNDSKIHKKSDGKVKSKMTSSRTKGRAIAGEAGSVIADNIEGGDNLKASLEVGREVSRPARDTVAAGRMPKYGEQLLALSTCDNGKGKDWRFVVLGRKV